MIWDEVQHKPHPAFFQCGLERREFLFASLVKINLGWVRDVISMTATAAAPKNW
jgi:hypothetical protein